MKRGHGKIGYRTVFWLAAGSILLWAVGGCTPQERYRVLSFLFDGVPEPGEERIVEGKEKPSPKKRPPAAFPAAGPPAALKKKADLKTGETLLPAERSVVWEEIERLLPKDPQNQVDWMEALLEGTIQPRSSVEPGAPDPEALSLDVKMIPEEAPEFWAIFRHGTHTLWSECEMCHTDLFEMEKGSTSVTMERIYEGRDCGACHGTVAFAIDPNCGKCHPGMGEEG
ncbi:MAG TPA: cytochrome c3 family protein [Nitrospiria bacterium]